MAVRATRRGQDVEPFQYWRSDEVKAAGLPPAEVAAGRKDADARAPWDPAALEYLFNEGFSLQFPAVELYGSPQRHQAPVLAQTMTARVGCYVRFNMYVTPPGEQGFKSHFDAHGVYVMQIRGSKRWRVYGAPPVRLPVSDWGDARLARLRPGLGAPLLDVVLRPGDALYIPQGFLHEADTRGFDETSVHITAGFMTMKAVDAILVAARLRLAGGKHAAALGRLQRALRTMASAQEGYRRSAVTLCGDAGDDATPKLKQWHVCGDDTPAEWLVELFKVGVAEALGATATTDPLGDGEFHDQNTAAKEALLGPGVSVVDGLRAALAWRRKKLQRFLKKPRAFSLDKLQPVTEAMKEVRAPKRIKT